MPALEVAVADEVVERRPERQPRDAEIAAEPPLRGDRLPHLELVDQLEDSLPGQDLFAHGSLWKHSGPDVVKTTSSQSAEKSPLLTCVLVCANLSAVVGGLNQSGKPAWLPHAPGGDMKARFLVVAVLAAMLAVAATTASGGTSKGQADKIVVWLQNDAQNGWPEAVALANRNFKAQHPDVDVDVQYQSWGTHLQKFDAGLAGGDAPDVIELGNTEMTKYMAAGAFKTLSQSAFPNNKTWLQGLKDSCQYNGKLYGVPYYAGARAVIYRKDQYKAAGIKSTPKSFAQFLADGKKLMKKYGKKTVATRRSISRASTGTSRCPSSTTTAGRSRCAAAGSGRERSTPRRHCRR